ncbi:polysaccharide pyruvyl transferase family protein [Nguyenibacter vanlangensis]|uniref:Polysaccharide pyruvyl transferase family protein n=1 Tax=Nguyenibacter vanlangensis TaxID=1216886 RepID=A0ABZ3D3I4_9PROT
MTLGGKLGIYDQLLDDPFIKFLKSIEGSTVHFFPKSGNAGDGFISSITYHLFEHFNIKYISHPQSDTVEDALVLIGGGGNLIEGRYHDVYDLIQRHVARNRVVLLPHSIVGFSSILEQTFGSLTVFCRDAVSWRLALLNGANPERTHLSHDVTFFADDTYFSRYLTPGKGTLQALRTDGEAAGVARISEKNQDISLSWNGDLWTSPVFCHQVTASLAAFLSQFESVYTDRLHISILSAFLGKRVFLAPNAYFKNRAVHEHSMAVRFPNVQFFNTLPTVEEDEAPAAERPELAPAGSELDYVGTISDLQKSVSELQDALVRSKAEYDEKTGLLEGELADGASALSVATQNLMRTQEELAHYRESLAREVALRSQTDRQIELQRHQFEEILEARDALEADLRNEQQREERLRADEARLRADAARKIVGLEENIRHLQREISVLRSSTSWRVTASLRNVGEMIPGRVRGWMRGNT